MIAAAFRGLVGSGITLGNVMPENASPFAYVSRVTGWLPGLLKGVVNSDGTVTMSHVPFSPFSDMDNDESGAAFPADERGTALDELCACGFPHVDVSKRGTPVLSNLKLYHGRPCR